MPKFMFKQWRFPGVKSAGGGGAVVVEETEEPGQVAIACYYGDGSMSRVWITKDQWDLLSSLRYDVRFIDEETINA